MEVSLPQSCFSIAAELAMNSLDAHPSRVYIRFDLLDDIIRVRDDGKGICFLDDRTEENGYGLRIEQKTTHTKFKRGMGGLLWIIENFKVSIISQTNYIRTPIIITNGLQIMHCDIMGKGTEVVVKGIVSFFMTKKSKMIVKPAWFYEERQSISKFISTVSLLYPNISFFLEGSGKMVLVDLKPVLSFDDRWRQITGLKPRTSPDGKVSCDIILSLSHFTPFLVGPYPSSFAVVGGKAKQGSKKFLQIIDCLSSDVDVLWTKDGMMATVKSNMKRGKKSLCKVSPEIISHLEYVGIWDRRFIIGELDGVLYAVDQHAAHERVNLSKLLHMAIVDGFVSSFILQKPIKIDRSIKIDLTPKSVKEAAKWGWSFAGSMVTAVPNVSGVIIDSITGLAEYIESVNHDEVPPIPDCILDSLRTRACKTAIRFGDFIDEQRARALLKELANSDLPNHCAHGRTVVAPLFSIRDMKFL